MLVQGTSILVREAGQRQAVENLKISDLIFDPFAGKYCEIVDILARSISFGQRDGKPCTHPLQPIAIPRDFFGRGRPFKAVSLSPSQGVFLISKDETSKFYRSQVETVSSFEHSSGAKERDDVTVCKYFALFTDQPSYLDAEGLILTTYSYDVYSSA